MRPSRLRRDLLVDIDLGVALNIPAAAQATEDQLMMAYSRALRRTGDSLKSMALKMLKQGIAPKKVNMLRRRLLAFSSRRNPHDLNELKVWFGLNKIKVKDLRGRLNGQRQMLARDPDTGRFIEAKGKGKKNFAVFKSSGDLGEIKFDNAYVSRGRGGRTIRIYNPETRRSSEAEVDIYESMLNRIEDDIFPEAARIFFSHFEKDLNGRVKNSIHVDRKTRRRIK